MTPINLMMPWPVLKPLSPNWRGHWSAKAKAKKVLRHEWAMQARTQGATNLAGKPSLSLSIEFVPPDRRARDLDNMLATIKAGLDGLADVLGVDDSCWTLQISKAAGIGGFVRVTVS